MSEPNRQYFEDIQVGDEYLSRGRTVTEADVVAFAGLSGDYNVLHTDAEYMKSSIFGERIAHGLLGLSISSGLGSRAVGSEDDADGAARDVLARRSEQGAAERDSQCGRESASHAASCVLTGSSVLQTMLSVALRKIG